MDKWNYNISRIGGWVFYGLALCCLLGIIFCKAYHQVCTMIICIVMGRVLFADAAKIKREYETTYRGKL